MPMLIALRRGPWLLGLAAACLASSIASAEKARPSEKPPSDSTLATELTAGEADGEPARRQLLGRPEWNLGFTTLHLGGGLLFDGVAYSQDSASERQFPDLAAQIKLRDFRFLL